MPGALETPVWPETLVNLIGNQDFVLFLGAGLSANAANSRGETPPRWRELLEDLTANLITHNSTAGLIRRFIKAKDYLSAAEHLAYFCENNSLLAEFRNRIVRATDGGDNSNDAFFGGAVYGLISDLNPRIIVTTNYDRILERHFVNGFRVKHFEDSDIASNIRQGAPVLLKLHGTADTPEKTILTRTDFARLRRTGGHALETVQALLLTRTVLFLGYSLDDPDLRLLLENLFGAQGQLPAHYLLGSNRIPLPDRRSLKEVYGTQVLAYGGEASPGVERSLQALVARLQANTSP